MRNKDFGWIVGFRKKTEVVLMESYFKDHIFATDLDFWEYLKSLKEHKFTCADGSYMGELQWVPGGLQLREMWYFKTEKECGDFCYHRPRKFASFAIDGKWAKSQVLDYFNYEYKQYTPEEMQEACKELVKLMVVESKKVS